MAIVHMKKLRLMVVRRQKDELLRDLMLLGCVQISEPDALACGRGICRSPASGERQCDGGAQ